MGPIFHRLPADKAAANAARFELTRRRILGGLEALRQRQPLSVRAPRPNPTKIYK